MVSAHRRAAGLVLLPVLMGILSLSVGTATAQATESVSFEDAVPGIAPPSADKNEVYLDSTGQEIPMNNSAPVGQNPDKTSELEAAAIGCTPISGRDNPHYSSGDVSGHGWWHKGTCSNNRAKVRNCLYEYCTNGSWRLKVCSPTKELNPGGGSASRTVARTDCDNRTSTSWRNHVDVDVIGEIDTGENPYTQAQVACRVY